MRRPAHHLAWIAAVLVALVMPAAASAGLLPDPGNLVPLPPVVATGSPVDVTTGAGTLTGSVLPNGLPTTYHFDYGPTPLYGSSTPAQDAGSGTAPVDVTAQLANLTPGSVVHYRLVAGNALGTVTGLDRPLIVLTGGSLPDNLPHTTAVSLPPTATVGQPVTLKVSGQDVNDPVTALTIDFDDGPAFLSEAACRLGAPSGAFGGNRNTAFSVPYTFTRAGKHTLKVTLGSGDCGANGRKTSQTIELNVNPAQTAGQRRFAREVGAITAAGCTGANRQLSKRTRKVIVRATRCLINRQRRLGGLRALRPNAKLRKAAAVHNSYMARGLFFAHQGRGEPGLQARLRRAHYHGLGGENIGTGSGTPWATPRGMMIAWMNSPPHRANILDRRYRTIGVAVMPLKPLRPTHPGATYTTDFGLR